MKSATDLLEMKIAEMDRTKRGPSNQDTANIQNIKTTSVSSLGRGRRRNLLMSASSRPAFCTDNNQSSGRNVKVDVLSEMSVPQEPSDIEQKIIRQIEYYFGDYNLPKDRFMKRVMDENDGWIPMDVMLSFPRLKTLSENPEFIFCAIAKSRKGLVDVDPTGNRIRRNPSLPIPEINDATKKSIEQRTLFVTGFDKDNTKLDQIIDFFETNFEKVGNVRMRHARGEDDEEPRFLGSVFLTFMTRQAAQSFLNRKSELSFNGRKLFAKWQKEFFNTRTEYNDKIVPDELDKTVWVHGFDKNDTTEDELSTFFSQYPGAEKVRKRVFRPNFDDSAWLFTGSVFVTFGEVETAKEFVQRKALHFKGDRLKVKWQRKFYEEIGKFKTEMENI